MKLPESLVAGTKNAEDSLIKRLEEFRKINTDENTVLNYFDELEIHPIIINAELAENLLDSALENMMKIIGAPRNYGPTAEQIAEQMRTLEAVRLKSEQAAAEERAKREYEELERHKKSIADWVMYFNYRTHVSKKLGKKKWKFYKLNHSPFEII